MLWVRENENEHDKTVYLRQPSPAGTDTTSKDELSTPAPRQRRRRPKDASAYRNRASQGDWNRVPQSSGTTTPIVTPRLYELARILWRRRRLIFAIAATGTALAGVLALSVPPKYTATAQIVVRLPIGAAVERGAGVSLMDEAVDTHVTLLSSPDHLQRVIESFSQIPNASGSGSRATDTVNRADRKDGAQQTVALNTSLDGTEPESTGLTQFWGHLGIWIRSLRGGGNAALPSLEEVQRSTRVNQERRSRVISVAFTSTSPKQAAAFANRIAQLYFNSLINNAQASSTNEIARLNERLGEAKSELDKTRTAVQNAIQQRLSSASAARTDGREADGELSELERQAGIRAQLYSNLLQRKKAIRDQNEIASPGVEIHALASVPRWPSSHNPLFFIFPALLVFATGAGWLAVALEQRDRGLRSEREIVDALGIRCAALVPRILHGSAASPAQLLLTEPFAPYSESIRSVITALQLADTRRALNKVLLVGSSVPGEGKTTLALSLAACLALLGQRVLLIDFDFRPRSPRHRPDKGAEESAPDPQLANRLAEHIRRIPELGIDQLSMFQYGRDPLMLLASGQAAQVIHQLRASYDSIIIDGPPLLGIAEARLLPSIADRVLFVVKWGSTSREFARNALGLLYSSDCLPNKCAPPLAVVTQVDLKKHVRYGYGDAAEYFASHGKY